MSPGTQCEGLKFDTKDWTKRFKEGNKMPATDCVKKRSVKGRWEFLI